MPAIGSKRLKFWAYATLLLSMTAGMVVAATPPSADTAQLFARADYLKMIDNATYVKLIQQLESRTATMSRAEKWHLFYLEAWQTAYTGHNDKAGKMLETVATQAPDINLKEQAKATLINILGIGHRYEEAFTYLDQALGELPRITDKSTRLHVLAEAAQLLIEAGQYDLAISYTDQILLVRNAGSYRCIGIAIKLHAEFRKEQPASILAPELQRGLAECVEANDALAADTIRRDMASLALQEGKTSDAINILQSKYAEVQSLKYEDLISEYTAMLAEAYWKLGNVAQAENYAYATVDNATKSGFSEPLISAYQLLYQITRQRGDLREALAYHEKYMTADKDRLDDVREKALAYQIVKQQVEAKKVQLEELNKQNKILQLQQALDHKAMETSRLYIALQLTILASIVFWIYRLKRSQLRFMQLARMDGLTGIFNRQHFVDEAEQALRYAEKSTRNACLILIDLDHFKAINDTHGHVVGDNVLRRAVSICQLHLHSCDVFGRIGGEEFAILLPECAIIQAVERAEHIRAAIHAMPDGEQDRIAMSASFGVASTSHYGHDLRRLLLAADSALYRAKREGRNRVVVSMSDHLSASSNATAKPPLGGQDTSEPSSQYVD